MYILIDAYIYIYIRLSAMSLLMGEAGGVLVNKELACLNPGSVSPCPFA